MGDSKVIRIGSQEYAVKMKRIYQKDLTPECWMVQVWGFPTALDSGITNGCASSWRRRNAEARGSGRGFSLGNIP